jgi:DNA-binding IclR family transcriptional regulator
MANVSVRRRTRARRAARARQAGASPGDGLQSLTTGFRILDVLTQSPGPMGLTDIAVAVGELKPRVHRHLSTMKSLGVVFQDARNGRYGLGGKLFALGEAALDQYDLRFVADPLLMRLRDETQQTALLSIPHNGEAVVLSCIEYDDRLSISSRPGNRPPGHCSAQGRVALAFAEEAVRKRVLEHKLTPFTAHSLCDRRAVEARLPLIRERFYEDAVDEVRLGINTIAAPVFRDDGDFAAIISILGTSAEIGSPPRRQLVAAVHKAAGQLSAELDCRIYYERGLVK